jgi:cell division protein FtsB
VGPASPRRRARTGAEVRRNRRRALGYAFFGLAVVLMVNALVGENGLIAGLRAQREYESMMSDVIRLRLENQQLREQARRLRDDPAAIEETARRDLGLVRSGETLVIVHDIKTAGK